MRHKIYCSADFFSEIRTKGILIVPKISRIPQQHLSWCNNQHNHILFNNIYLVKKAVCFPLRQLSETESFGAAKLVVVLQSTVPWDVFSDKLWFQSKKLVRFT